MIKTAKIFKNGRSQAVRLPAEFRFEGSEVDIRRDVEWFGRVRTAQRLAQHRIHRHVPRTHLLVDDRAQLVRPGRGRILAALIPDLLRDADPDRQMVARGNREPRPDVTADDVVALATASAGKEIEAGLEPLVETMSDFERLVERVVGRQHSLVNDLATLDGKVAVDFDHGRVGRDEIGAVHLDFVVVLGREWDGS